MYYYEALKEQDKRLLNLSKQLENPTLMRVDINLPTDKNGKILENTWRMQVNADVINLLSNYTGLVLLSHQARPKIPPTETDFKIHSLKHHETLLKRTLPRDLADELEFVSFDNTFKSETKEDIRNLKPGQIRLFENVRLREEEYNTIPNSCIYTQFFKSAGIQTCVNEGLAVLHRNNRSLMCLPEIAQTYVGMRSAYEIRNMDEIKKSNEEKAMVVGGKKPKWRYLDRLSQDFKIFTGGVAGIIMIKAKDVDIGTKNDDLLKREYSDIEREMSNARSLLQHSKNEIETPIDFVVLENGEKHTVYAEELGYCKGDIMDIGEETVELYAEKLQGMEKRIMAGPLGVFEEGYDNGIKLTRRIAGDGLMFLGGDTSQQIIQYGLERPILNCGGELMTGGGACLHYLADERFPSIDILLKN